MVETNEGFNHNIYIYIDVTGHEPRKRILDLINQSWTEGKLPEQWKTAVVIPITTPGGKATTPSPCCLPPQ